MRKPSFPSARKIYKVRMYSINRYRDGAARIYACGDSRLRGLGSRKPIDFKQWVVHITNRLPMLEAFTKYAVLIIFQGIKSTPNTSKAQFFTAQFTSIIAIPT